MKQLLIILFVAFAATLPAQDTSIYTNAHVTETGDTVYESSIAPVTIIDKKYFSSNLARSKFNKLKRNVTIVYPYAKIAGTLYTEMNTELDEMDKRRKQRKYKKARQRELEAEFEEKLRDLTTTQGKILVMLINRETGNNCYELIKELKNPLVAWGWQLVAKRWDYDLKEAYVPEDNPDIELILQLIEEEARLKQVAQKPEVQ